MSNGLSYPSVNCGFIMEKFHRISKIDKEIKLYSWKEVAPQCTLYTYIQIIFQKYQQKLQLCNIETS